MLQSFRYLYRDVSNANRRKLFVSAFLKDIPGEFGIILRRKWYSKLFERCGKNLRILPGTIIIRPEKIQCGDDVSFGINNYIQASGGLILGNNVMMGPYVKIWTITHNYQKLDIPVRLQGYSYDRVIIGDDVWIGADAFIMPGAELGNQIVVSASSVLSGKRYPDRVILMGYPARKIGLRGS